MSTAPPPPDGPTPPDRKTRVFVAYDFEIGGTLPANLNRVKKAPPEGFEVDWPGDPEGQSQNAIWKARVRPAIAWCDRLLAFVDLPNANVGFEIGYALGLGKKVALALHGPTRNPWLSQPPFHGFLCPPLEGPSKIRQELQAGADGWPDLPPPTSGGPEVLFLCPPVGGESFLEEIPEEWGWRTLRGWGWDLLDIPELLNGVGLVVWFIAPHTEGTAGRDGRENAALSVVAGYAEALPGVELHVLRAVEARAVADVIASGEPFPSVDGFFPRVRAIKADWDARQADRKARPPGEAPAVPRPPIAELPFDTWVDIPPPVHRAAGPARRRRGGAGGVAAAVARG